MCGREESHGLDLSTTLLSCILSLPLCSPFPLPIQGEGGAVDVCEREMEVGIHHQSVA